MGNQWTSAEHAIRCLRYTSRMGTACMLGFAYAAWRSFEGLVEWRADGADFPWVALVATVVLLGFGTGMGTAARFGRYELARLIQSERKLLRLDPDVDLLAD